MFGLDPANGARPRAHHHGIGDDLAALEPDAIKQVALGDAGGREQNVTLGHVFHGVLLGDVLDPHAPGALDLVGAIDHQPPLHLAAEAA